MTEKTIEICKKQVKVAYCMATEQVFEQLAEKSIRNFDANIQKDTMLLGMAAILAAAQSKHEEPSVTLDDLMFDAKPNEVIALITAVVECRNEWYDVPAALPEDETTADEEEGEKN